MPSGHTAGYYADDELPSGHASPRLVEHGPQSVRTPTMTMPMNVLMWNALRWAALVDHEADLPVFVLFDSWPYDRHR